MSVPHISDCLSDTTSGYIWFALLIAAGEILYNLIFYIIRRLFSLPLPGSAGRELFKGILERVMLAVGIAHGIVTVVIAFGALKVATKLSFAAADKDGDHVIRNNDYFLVGNLLSILFAIVYAILAVRLGFVSFKLTP